MKHLYLTALLSVFIGNAFAQMDWMNVEPPTEIQSNVTVNQYQVDDDGNVYAIYSYFDGTNQKIAVDQYVPLNQLWSRIYVQVIPNSIAKIKVDKTGGIIYFSFVAEQFPTPLFKVYKIENGSVSLIVSDLVPEYNQNTQYEFKAGDQPGELYWFFENGNATDLSLASWDPGVLDIQVFNIPYYSGFAATGLQLQQVGDTLWFSAGQSTTDTRLVKTHESDIAFLSFDGGPDGLFKTLGGDNLFAEETHLLSNRTDKLTLRSIDASGTPHEFTGVNGVFSLASLPGYFYPYPTEIAQSNGSNSVFAFANFKLDAVGTSRELHVMKKDYGTDSWLTLGSATTNIFKVNDNYVTRASFSYSEATFRGVAGYDSAANIVPYIRVLNDIPDVGTLTATLENTICPGTTLDLFSEFSLEDNNKDVLKIVGVTSTDISIIDPTDVTAATGTQIGNRQYFDISISNSTAGTCDLTFNISDGYDTVQATITVNVTTYNLASTTDGSNCGAGTVTLNATVGAGVIDWYDLSSGGIYQGSGTSFTTPSISVSTDYYAEATDNNCVTPRLAVTADIFNLPSVDAGTDQSVCDGATVTLAGSGASSYIWDNAVSDGVGFVPSTGTITYTVSGTDANGCVNTDQIDVTVNVLPTIDAGTDQYICDGDAVTLSGAGGVSYSWDNGVTDGVAFVPLVGTVTYTVTGTDGNGCISTDQIDVTVNSLPAVDAGLDQTVCEGDLITLSGSGAGIYVWDNGASDGVAFNSTTTTTFNVTGTDANGCINTDGVTITVNAAPPVNAGIDQTICDGDNVTLSGGGAVSYSWDLGVSDGVAFSPSATATYTVTGTDGNGCTNTDQTDIFVNDLPTVGAGANQTVCEGDMVTLNGSGASSYSWDNGESDGVPFAASTSTIYTVTGTDANGCINTDQVFIIVNSLPNVNAGSDIDICTGSSVTLNGAGASSYSWDNGVSDGVSFSPGSTLTYTVTGTDANGCENTDQVDVNVNNLPTVNAGADQVVCNGDIVSLNGAGASSYSWDNGVSDGATFNATSTTTYTVTGTDGNGCIDTDQVTITVNALPTVNAGGDATICNGDPITLSGSGASSYSWDNGVTDGVSFNPTFTNTYTLTGTDGNGCISTDQVDINVNNLPFTDAGSDQNVCNGTSVTLSGSGAVSYSWDNGVSDGIAFTPGATTTYTVTGTDGNGCISTDDVIVTVYSIPSVSAGADQVVCSGQNVTLAGTGASSYSWDNGVFDAVPFAATTTTTYTVIGTDANGCAATDQATVTVDALPAVDAGLDQSICQGAATSLSASGAISYVWNNGVSDGVSFNPSITKTYTVTGTDGNGCQNTDQVDIVVNSLPGVDAGSNQTVCTGTSITLSGSGATSYTWDNGVTDGVAFAAGVSTAYTVTGTDGNGCTGTDQVFVIVNTLPNVSAGTDLSICLGDAVVLSGSGTSFYSWDNGVVNGVSFNPGITKTYTLTGTDGNGCENTDQVIVTVNALPTVSAGTDQTVCENANVVLNGSGASSYTWDNGVFDGVIFNPTSTLTYTVTGTDGNGCQNTDQVDVITDVLPTVNAGIDQTICAGDAVTLNGSGAISYTWDNSVSDGVAFNPASTLTYTVTGTDGNGCQNTDQVDVIVNALPAVDAGTDQTICLGNAVTLFGFGASTYTWDNGITDGISFNPAATLTYTVTGTDFNGCISTDQVDVTVNSLPTVNAGPDQTVCDGATVVLGGSGAVSYSWDNFISDSIPFTAAATTTYTVTGTDVNGCINTDQVDVIVNALPAVDAGLDQTVCSGTGVVLAGAGASTYTWDNSVTDNVSFIPLSTLTYTLTGTDVNGCQNTDQVDVFINTLPVVDAGTDQTICLGDAVTLFGFGASTYTWDNGVTDAVAFNPTATLTYTVTGTDFNGCISTDQVDVIVNSLPTVNAGPNQTVCDGATVVLGASGAVSYFWDNFISDSIPFTAAATTTYTVTGTDVNGCINTDQVDVIVNSLPLVDAGTDQTICETAPVVLSGSGASTYTWDNSVNDGVSFNPTISLTYTVTGTDVNGCQNTDQVDVFVNPLPFVDAGADQVICTGTSVILSGSGTTSYSWDNSVADGVAFSPVSTLTYTVTGTDGSGCTNTDQVDVIVNPLPIVDAGFDQSVCESSPVILGASGAVSYSWDNGIFDSIPFNPTTSLTYTVTGIDANGCTDTDQVDVAVIALPTVITTPSIEVCEFEKLTLTASSIAPILLWYDVPAGGVEIASGSTYETPILTASTTYYVEAFENGCSSNRIPIAVSINGKPVINISSTASDCGNTNGTATASINSGTAPFSYYWSSGEQQVFSISGLSTGSYYFNVEDAKGCKAIGVTEVKPSSITINPIVAHPSCFSFSDGSVDLNVSGLSGQLTYLWNTGNNTATVSGLKAGTYEVSITNDVGCIVTASFELIQPDLIENTVSTVLPNCGENDGQILVANTTGGAAPYFYSWSNGKTGTNNNSITYGVYTLNTTDNSGCQVQKVYYLSEKNAPLIEGAVTETQCGVNIGAVNLDITPFPGDAVQSISWSNGQTTEDIANLAAGNYVSFISTVQNCVAVNGWKVEIGKPTTQEICLVTVDSVTTTNLVVWEKVQTTGISHYNIYRESNQIDDYQLIDTVDFNSLSVFNDVIASPTVRSWRYKISAVDQCGTESLLSAHHKTLHLNTFDLGASGVKVTWDKYEGTAFTNYILWRYSDINGWENIATLPTSVLNFTDATQFSEPGLDYMVEITLDEVCTATIWRAQDFNTSRSNKEKGVFNPGSGTGTYPNNSLVEFENGTSVNVYPNPFENTITLEMIGSEKIDISIFDIHGKLIHTQNCYEGQSVIDTQELSDGVYFVKTMVNKQEQTIKIIKQ